MEVRAALMEVIEVPVVQLTPCLLQGEKIRILLADNWLYFSVCVCMSQYHLKSTERSALTEECLTALKPASVVQVHQQGLTITGERARTEALEAELAGS